MKKVSLHQSVNSFLKPRKCFIGSNGLPTVNSHNDLVMAGKPDQKNGPKCQWKVFRFISIIFALILLVFLLWDFWIRRDFDEKVQVKEPVSEAGQDDALAVTSKDILFAIGTGSFITITPRRPLKEEAVVHIQFDDPDIVETIGSFVIQKNSLASKFVPLHSKKVAGHCTASFKSSSAELKNLFKLQVHIKVVHEVLLGYVSVLLGWGYFVCWSATYYPQIYKNWKRRSVVGLSFDYLALNATGHFCYLVFNTAMYYNSTVQKQYTKLHPKGLLPVKLNDVLFSVHACTMNLILIGQCLRYERGEQRLAPSMLAFVGGLWSTMAAGLFVAICERVTWLRYLYYLSYIKVGTTPIKYTPQVYLHFLRKSTEGWSIHSVFLDLSGGGLSLLQMSLDAINNDDWDGTYGNPGKLGLSLIAMMFGAIFMTQHFILYPNTRKPGTVQEQDIPEFSKKLEDFRTSMLPARKNPLVYDL